MSAFGGKAGIAGKCPLLTSGQAQATQECVILDTMGQKSSDLYRPIPWCNTFLTFCAFR
jgi:coproporphyrinogen III oxidase-like Fe-S oxidoreductase